MSNNATRSVRLWIDNDEPVYRMAVDFMKTYKGNSPYDDFVKHAGITKDGDGVRFDDPSIDRSEMNEIMRDYAPVESSSHPWFKER